MDGSTKNSMKTTQKEILETQIRDLKAEIASTQTQCKAETEALEKEKCSLQSVREAVQKTEADGSPITDCELSEWSVGVLNGGFENALWRFLPNVPRTRKAKPPNPLGPGPPVLTGAHARAA